MVIEIDLTDASTKKACDKLNYYINSLPKRIVQFEKKLAEVGAAAARGAYGPSVTVSVVPYDGGKGVGYKVVANGNAVCFLEFGAGDLTDTSHPFASEVPFQVRPGSYSAVNSKQYSERGCWHFGGQIYFYVKPVRGLWEAHKAIRRDILKVANEVFSKK